jgi:acyl carrier protein
MTPNQVKQIVVNTLNLGNRAGELTLSSPLLGAIPELDSMAVVGIITALEEQFGFTVDDDEISAESFETLGSLTAFVERKLDE